MIRVIKLTINSITQIKNITAGAAPVDCEMTFSLYCLVIGEIARITANIARVINIPALFFLYSHSYILFSSNGFAIEKVYKGT